MITVHDRIEFLKKLKTFLTSWVTSVEIGCYKGDFSEQLFSTIDHHRLYLVDAFAVGGKRYGKELNNLQTAYSDETIFKDVTDRFSGTEVIKVYKGYSFDVVKKFFPHVFDLIYHDASHLYEDLKRDLNDWLPKLKLNGLMCGHDYIDHPDFGVIQAVDEFCAEHNFKMIILNENGGDYALKRV